MSKFKIGDKVKITNDYGIYVYQAEITSIGFGKWDYVICFEQPIKDNLYLYLFMEEDLELINELRYRG